MAQAAENLAQLEQIHEVKAELEPTNCLVEHDCRHYSFLNRKKKHIFTHKTEKKKIIKLFDECVGAVLHVCVSSVQTLTNGLAEQVKSDRARLEKEIKQAAEKATQAIQKWYEHMNINCENTF